MATAGLYFLRFSLQINTVTGMCHAKKTPNVAHHRKFEE
jgi:hypothetical protein